MTLTSISMAGDIVVQYDLAAFPSHDLRTIDDAISIDIDLGVDQDNGSCTVTTASVPPDAVERIRLYVYAGSGGSTLIFNGEVVGLSWGADHTFQTRGRDAMARLRNKWTLEDRTYTSATEQSVVQNLVEASGIDASLTSIAGASWLIGVAQPVVLHGGVIDVLTGDPGQADVPLDLIRLIDRSTPLYVTYSAGDGAVYRKPRALGGNVEAFGGSDTKCWNVTRERSADEVVNACKVIGLTLAGVPLESLYQATSSWVFDPPKYITEELNSYLIEDQTQADLVSAAIVGYKNGRKNVVTFTTALNAGIDPADTVAISDSFLGLNTIPIFITNLKHHIAEDDAYTTIVGEFFES